MSLRSGASADPRSRWAGGIWILWMSFALSACDGSSTGPRSVTAPIELESYVTVELLGDPPGGLYTDYCECVSGPVLLVASGRPPETVECQGSYGVPYSGGQRREITLIGRGWRVSDEYTLSVDPHLDIGIEATCREL